MIRKPELATPRDAGAIRALQEEARAWLQSRGLDQWATVRHTDPDSSRSLESAIARGEVWIWRDHIGTVATTTLDDFADPEFWTANDDPDDALYVHRMVVRRSAAGNGLGTAILDWASAYTAASRRTWLRLDAWRSNTRLQDYYRTQGFTHVRTVELPHRGSGALFQRPAMPAARPRIHEAPPDTAAHGYPQDSGPQAPAS
ncbi:GNAT family N-acetyltransferase [Myceligenerans pegani]|uniref:GNAT family N-acetyltransferase n=1 Tax=Myceligenerans pegani TaxID=2776917 RepID=A0ABR9N1D4_9MICO|nr:GNAT family N-acetyltransferase [Myceligenerans sp. TRM 65318]MBE1877467.1 GNAT family N-acetyltransferase [Myceligenerans sp. TRM 65318]MBE3019738.1 GNAT family N-acetyltransferase [Myceligenerans sp. TRM 65318]